MVRLSHKIAASFLLVISVAILSFTITAGLRAPVALNRHIQEMESHIGADSALADNLRVSFKQTMREVLVYSVITAAFAAVLVSSILSRKIETTIRAMSEASRRIADGEFHMRVRESGNDEITDLARSFNRMAENLEQTELRRLRLIGDVAHELRTPLAGVISIVEGISDGVLPANTEVFADVLNETFRLKRLVNDLEELSRLSGDGVKIYCSRFNPVNLLEDITRRLQPQFEGHGIHLKLLDNVQGKEITSDPNRVSQIIHNLLSNALRYTPEGGEVVVSTTVTSKELVITVKDTGIGIPDEELKKIFERFYRIDASRSRSSGGSGIGLAVSLRLARLLLGNLIAQSAGAECGSTFTLTLPLDQHSCDA